MLMSNSFPYLTVSEAAQIVGITNGRLCQLLRAGVLKGHKAGNCAWMIPRKEIERFKAKPQTTGRPRVGNG